MKKAVLIILAFYILVLLQTSFLVHFDIFGIVPNFVIIAVILVNIFENPEKKLGIVSGISGGIFFDIFSQNFLGFYTLILLASALFFKYIIRRYINMPTLH